MSLKTLSLFWKILIILFGVGLIVLVLGRNHFILGTILIIFRWLFFVFGLVMLNLTVKRTTPMQFKTLIMIALLIIPLEFGWNKITEKSLKNEPNSIELSLMTYNVFFKNSNPQSSIRNIENYDPDILVIQELTPDWNVNLDNSIRKKYPYTSISALRGTHGIGVYSKFPIIDSKLFDNTKYPFAQIVELTINNKKVQLINLHLASPATAVEHPENFINLFGSNYDLRKKQIERINEFAKVNEDAFHTQILIGDLNTTRFEPIYRDIKSHWVDLYDLVGDGWGFNFPNSRKLIPILTLDYILVRGVVKGIDIKVIEGGGSDHLAIAGKIKI